MQTQPFYIATPIGELNSPHWRAIMHGPDGYKIVVMAILIRDIALSCNAGGLICHPSGEPMSTEELAAILGVEAVWLRPVLAGPLSRSGFVNGDDGGWVCGDGVAKAHFAKLERKPSKLLPLVEDDEEAKERKRQLARDRQRRRREKLNPQLPLDMAVTRDNSVTRENVTRDIVRDGSVTERDGSVTERDVTNHNLPESLEVENSENPVTRDVTRHGGVYIVNNYSNKHHHHRNVTSRHGDAELRTPFPDPTPLLIGIPTHEARKLRLLIEDALKAGHDLHACQAAIDEARRGSTHGRPWYGLAHHKLKELAAALPVLREAVGGHCEGIGVECEEKTRQKRLQLQKQLLLLPDSERQAIEAEAVARASACVADPSPGILAEFQVAVYAERIGEEM